MDEHLVWLLIALVIGVIVSNLMVLKYSAKFKWPGTKTTLKRTTKTSRIKYPRLVA